MIRRLFFINLVWRAITISFSSCLFPAMAMAQMTAAKAPFTFGWEIEFAAGKKVKENEFAAFPQHRRGIKDPKEFTIKTHTTTYPFLFPEGTIEFEGNIEITSVPFSDFAQAFSTLQQAQKIIDARKDLPAPEDRTSVKSLHLHTRFDKKMVEGISAADFQSWVARLADYIFLYRLKNKNPMHTLRYSILQTRLHPDFLQVKGTAKLISDDYNGKDYGVKNVDILGAGAQYDLELRGLMSDFASLKKITKKITEILPSPQRIWGFSDYQKLTYMPAHTFGQELNLYRQEHGHAPLSDKEIQMIDQYIQIMTYGREDNAFKKERKVANNDRVLLPLLGLEFMPYISPKQRTHIQEQNLAFWMEMNSFFTAHSLSSLLEESSNPRAETHAPFFKAFKKWVINSDIFSALEEVLFHFDSTSPTPKEDYAAFETSLLQDPLFIKFLVKRIHLPSARQILSKVSLELLQELFTKKVLGLPEARQIFLNAHEKELMPYRAYTYALITASTLPPVSARSPMLEESAVDLTQFLQNFSQHLDGFWNAKELSSINQKLLLLGIKHPTDLMGRLTEVNDGIECLNKSQSGKKKLKKLAESTLLALGQYFQWQQEESFKWEQALDLIAQRMGQTSKQKQNLREKLHDLHITTYQQLKEKHRDINKLIKLHNDQVEEMHEGKKHTFLLPSSLLSIARVMSSMEYFGVL